MLYISFEGWEFVQNCQINFIVGPFFLYSPWILILKIPIIPKGLEITSKYVVNVAVTVVTVFLHPIPSLNINGVYVWTQIDLWPLLLLTCKEGHEHGHPAQYVRPGEAPVTKSSSQEVDCHSSIDGHTQ